MTDRKVVKTVENATLFSDGTILVKGVRLSYPHLDAPWSGGLDDNGQPQKAAYGCVGIMPKATHAKALALIVEEIDKELKANNQKTGKGFPADRKFCRDGDNAGKEELVDSWYFSVREPKRAPALRDAKKRVVPPEKAAEVFYAGCWVNILLRPWFQLPGKYGTRVNANLIAVQRIPSNGRPDEPFGVGRISEEAIDATFDDEGEDSSFDEDDFDGL
jgi:hypothetical protein